MNEKSSGLMMTFISGCWERGDKMEIEIQLKNSPSFYGVILKKGSKDTLFEMENPPVQETSVDDAVPTPDLYRKTHRQRPRFRANHIEESAKIPPCMDLVVYLYYGPSFERTAQGDAEAKAMRIADVAKRAYLHPEFSVKLNVTIKVIKLAQESFVLKKVKPLIPKENLSKIGRIHAFLVSESLVVKGVRKWGTSGRAYLETLCKSPHPQTWGPYLLFTNRFTGANITRTDMTTGQTLAHEMGHSMGLHHDFKNSWRGRKQSCGPGKFKTGGALMNYGVRGKTWSKCSVEDFKNYYIQQTRDKAFCLKTSESHKEFKARKLLTDIFIVAKRVNRKFKTISYCFWPNQLH